MTVSQQSSSALEQCSKRSEARLLDALVYIAIFGNAYELPCKTISLLFRPKRSLQNRPFYRLISLYTTLSKSPEQWIYLSEFIIGLVRGHLPKSSAFTPKRRLI